MEGRNNKGQFKKEFEPWCKGQKIDRSKYPRMGHFKKHTEEAKKKMSIARRGKPNPKQSETMKRLFSEGVIKPWQKGLTKETDKRLMGMGFKKGHAVFSGSEKGWFRKGHRSSPGTEFKKGQFVLERHFNWKGGSSFEPYTVEFTDSLKEDIRKRDEFICQLCNRIQNTRKHNIHHIDYNKKNCSIDNLITLCAGCNTKVNFNREYWKMFFINKINKG